ncbi:CPBP family intramembrane glutamic endopeptidase [Actinomadura sp. B10D3]|uniref:CPBP family intramembrane glutamic endopeptidase n=1 Tax=Actinomadura sp. B10D3 TaxID=3153557 RepID=UPI00325F019D
MRFAVTESSPPVRTSYARAFGRALAGMLIMAFALGCAGALSDIAHDRLGISGTARLALTAAICCALAVPPVLLIRREIDRLPLRGLGLPGAGESLRSFVTGLIVTGGAAAAMLILGTNAGWLRWGPLDWPRLVTYVVVNAMIAFALEALPEELTIRGYAYRNLNARLRRWTAFLCTIVLFTATPGVANIVKAVVSALLGGPVQRPGIAPPGEDPISYVILMVVFGFALLIARVTTGSLWTSIALHLTFLTVNRVTLLGEERDTGWSAETTTPDAVLLIPGYLLLTAVVFTILGRLRGRRIGWRVRDPEQPARAATSARA